MRNNGFISGMMAGLAIGALVVVAIAPSMRDPIVRNADMVGNRVRKMWRRGSNMAENMMPGDDL